MHEQAAAQGHAKAQFNLSQIYQLGDEVATNYRLAKDLLEVSAGQGHPAAMFNLGTYEGPGSLNHRLPSS